MSRNRSVLVGGVSLAVGVAAGAACVYAVMASEARTSDASAAMYADVLLSERQAETERADAAELEKFELWKRLEVVKSRHDIRDRDIDGWLADLEDAP